MADAAAVDIVADRWMWFTETYSFIGFNFTGADFAMQVRQTKDTTGTPLIDLSTATGGAQGVELLYAGSATITAHMAAGRLPGVPDGFSASDTVTLSQIRIVIDSLVMQGLPFQEERGSDNVFHYDLVVDLPTPTPAIYMRGTFTVRAGVTIV